MRYVKRQFVAVLHCLLVFHFLEASAELPESCFTGQWPNLTRCVEFGIEGENRYVHSNSLPPFHVDPYCPYGVGQGYCMKGETDCPFRGMVCPAQEGAPATGDVPVPTRTMFSMPAKPDPTDESKPLAMFHENDAKKWHNHVARAKQEAEGLQPPRPGHQPDTIGVHVSGTTLFGPSEAGGHNVDLAGLHLACGGHVTPPIATGPMYHFHKYQSCLTGKMAAEEEEESAGEHGRLIGWALDGFGIYDHKDVDGKPPVLDQCNGHFGYVPASDDFSDCKERKEKCESEKETMCSQCAKTCGESVCGKPNMLVYHYHSMPNITNMANTTSSPFKPYMMGCQGPSKGLCAQRTEDPRQGVVWCGRGCGYQLCVQPGVEKKDLESYIGTFQPAAANWLKQFTINPYSG